MQTRTYKSLTYKDCFVANEAVTWLVRHLGLRDRLEGYTWGIFMQRRGFIAYVHGWAFRTRFYFFAGGATT